MKSDSSWKNRCFDWDLARGIEVIPTIIYRREVPPDAEHLTVAQPFYTWWQMLQGEVLVKTDQEIVRVIAGHWILIPAGLRRTQQFQSGSLIISINFVARWAQGPPLVDMRRLLTATSGAVAHLSSLAKQVCKTTGKDEGPNQHSLRVRKISICDSLELNSALNRFVKVLLGHAIRCGGRLQSFAPDDGRLDYVLKSIRSKVYAGPLAYKEWQKQTGLGRSQLDRLAQAYLHLSLHQYRDQLLVADACRRLAAQETVKHTAAELGFVDSAHFCRWMRRHMGRSPLSLRNSPTSL